MTTLDSDDIARLDWEQIAAELDQEGYAILPTLISNDQARSMAALIGAPGAELRGSPGPDKLGSGDIFYLAPDLPVALNAWRAAFYMRLAPIANRWNEILGEPERFPASFKAFNAQNKKAGAMRSLSGLIRLRERDYQALHQHTESQRIFPLQLAVLLSEPETDFTGGEFVLTEQRPRMQSRPMVLPLRLGDAAIITAAQRPFKGRKGYYRVNIKHAITRVRSGERIGLELLFHNAPSM